LFKGHDFHISIGKVLSRVKKVKKTKKASYYLE